MAAVEKYLQDDLSLAEQEVHQLNGIPGHYTQGVVIPVFQEAPSIVDRFTDFAEKHPATLVIFVLNQPDDRLDNEWAKAFLKHDRFDHLKALWHSKNQCLSLFSINASSAILIVDRCINGIPIPRKQGVGLARKIGADILCALIHNRIVESPWIANTDADADLPENYFQSISNTAQSSNTAAVIFPYQHIFVDETPELPTLLYEFSLHYYVAGLRFAGSPYAFQTLGSTICAHYKHYAMVRGFPKRAGAEDFYLLNKLAKTGLIKSLETSTITLEARESARVPFGTGPAVTRLGEEKQPETMPLYHPDSFLYLKLLLLAFDKVSREQQYFGHVMNELVINDRRYQGIDVKKLLQITEKMDIESAIEHCFRHGKKQTTRTQHLHHWFDGFKTLKFVHDLRDTCLTPITFEDWRHHNADYSLKNTSAMESLQGRIALLINE